MEWVGAFFSFVKKLPDAIKVEEVTEPQIAKMTLVIRWTLPDKKKLEGACKN